MFCLISGGVTQPSASTVSSSGFRRKIYLLHAIANNIQFTKKSHLSAPAKTCKTNDRCITTWQTPSSLGQSHLLIHQPCRQPLSLANHGPSPVAIRQEPGLGDWTIGAANCKHKKNTTYQAMQLCGNNSFCLYIAAIYTDVSRALLHHVAPDGSVEVLEEIVTSVIRVRGGGYCCQVCKNGNVQCGVSSLGKEC